MATAFPPVTVAAITPPGAELGEGPVWRSRDPGAGSEAGAGGDDAGELLWLDILRKRVFRTAPDASAAAGFVTTELTKSELPSRVGAVAVARASPADGSPRLVAALEDGFYALNGATGEVLRRIAAVEAESEETRFNDGKVDPQGRFWCGSMDLGESKPLGSLYRMGVDGSVARVDGVGSVTISNGMAWSSDTMYYIDTPTRCVVAFDYDPASGEINGASRRTVVTFPDVDADGLPMGYPDGMCIDADGKLWIACWGGSRVCQWDPASGAMLRSVMLPALQVTCPAFGAGDCAGVLFATTATVGMDRDSRAKYPLAGAVFAIRGTGASRHPLDGAAFAGDVDDS